MPGTLGMLGPTRICVGKSLIFPIPLFLLPKFDAGKPGGESVSVLLYSKTLTEFPGNPGGESGSASLCTDAFPEFSGSAVLYSTALPRELYSGADSIASLCLGKNSSKPELLVVHRGNPVASTGMGGAILLQQQDWVEQSCCHSRIDKGNPVATAGLTRAILLPQQDWVEQSCCHSRVKKNTPSATLRGQHR